MLFRSQAVPHLDADIPAKADKLLGEIGNQGFFRSIGRTDQDQQVNVGFEIELGSAVATGSDQVDPVTDIETTAELTPCKEKNLVRKPAQLARQYCRTATLQVLLGEHGVAVGESLMVGADSFVEIPDRVWLCSRVKQISMCQAGHDVWPGSAGYRQDFVPVFGNQEGMFPLR